MLNRVSNVHLFANKVYILGVISKIDDIGYSTSFSLLYSVFEVVSNSFISSLGEQSFYT